ncbi:MAG: sensor histidine kinase [Acidimicrobiia bacterium]
MKSLVAAVVVIAAGMGALEVVMNPSGGDRLEPLALFCAMATVTLLATRAVPTLAMRTRTLGHTVAAVGLVAAGLIALGLVVGAWRMFLSVHDLHLLSIMLAVAAGLSVVFALGVARSVRTDLAALRNTTDRVAKGDLTARTSVSRSDELGATAAAIDEMIERLAAAEHQRRHDEEARRALLAAIGHDLRTPLAALQAAIEALQDRLATDPDRYLRAMGHDVAHLRALVDDLFLLARIEAGDFVVEREVVDLSELADETIEAMEPVARQRLVELHLETTGRVSAIGGPQALGRVMRNLVHNAIRYAPDAGNVVIRVFNGDGATVEVIDDGPGFDPTVIPAAFDIFVRADPARSRDTGGAGLGLAIAKGVVDAHGGEIWARPGPGGRVGFRLPISA